MTDVLILRGLIAASVLLVTGCAAWIPGTSVRNASFAPFVDTSIGGLSADAYLALRYAILTDPNRSLGSAVAIDQRGYFLTAAHCIGDESPRLLIPKTKVGSQSVIYEEASSRIVWRGSDRSGGMDLAVLAISAPIDHVFEWADESDPRDVALAVGIKYDGSKDERHTLDVGFFSGEILTLKRQEKAVPKHNLIEVRAPMHPGDSGGPLTTSDGRLLGINVRYGVSLFFFRIKVRAWAIQPDREWLRQVIDDDHASLTGKARELEVSVAQHEP